MPNTVQLTKNGQPVFPVTDVSLVMGLQDAIKLPPVKTATLPTASAETAGKMYYVGPTDGEYERYITSAVEGSYEWIDLGNTAIPLPSIADNLITDDSEMALSAAQGKVLDGKVSQLGQEVTGNIVKDVTWSNGYVQSNTGLIKASSLSQFSQPILLKAGEKVTIGTQNSNIGIICSTNADSVAVGDTVTVIKATSSSGQFETYEYTAEADIKIVICVLASNYNLSFYDDNNLTEKVSNAATKQELNSLSQEVGTNITNLQQEVNGNDNSQDIEFSIAVGSNDHSKTVDIKAGKYNITVDDANNALPQYTRIYLNGTSIGYLKSLTNPVTISEDVTTIRLYSSAQATNSGDITIHFVDVAPSKSLSERIDDVKAEADTNSQEVESLKDEVNFVVSAEWYQGIINATSGVYNGNNTRVTSAKAIQAPAKIVSTSSIKIYQIFRYKENKSPETGGTKGTDFIAEEYLPHKSSLIVYPNEDFPNVYVGLRKTNSSDTFLVSEVESSVTVYYDNSLQARVSALESPSATKVVDFGVINADPNNNMSYYWLNTPAKFEDYSEILLTVNKEDGINNKILVYAVYGNASNRERVLPDISASGETVIRIPANERESLYGIMLYNLYNISYEITARITLSAKKDATKYLDTVGQNANILPAYYFANDYVFKRRAVINKYLLDDILLGDAFFFVTDTHWEFNQRHSPALIREVNKKLNIQRVFHGGDLYHNSPVADAYETDCVNAYLAGIGSNKVAVALGNHEFLASETWADAFVRTAMHLENAQFGGLNKQYFYIDNTVKKIRYIVLYSYGQRVGGSYTYGFNDQEQMGWLNDVALNVESGWDIFIFTHYATSPRAANNEYAAIGGYDNLANLVNGYNGNGRIVAIITGHTHRDFVLLDRTNMPIIITTCDNNANFTDGGISDFDNLQTPRTTGTVNEQAVDTVIYDRGNCLLHFIRLGSEADNKMNRITTNTQVAVRSIYCTTKAVNDSVELPTYLTSGVTWESSDTSVATVSSGTVSCVGTGCVRITATDSNGEKQSFYLRVA